MDNSINLVSIVIPALNEEKMLAVCLGSMKNQDYNGAVEIVLADNGSTDRTAEIARSFGARVVPCFEKKSVFYARQKGGMAAAGDIIIQADADTIYPRDWLTRIVTQFSQHPDAVAVAGRFDYQDPPWWAPLEHGLRHAVNTMARILLGRPLIISGANFAFRRSSFVTLGGYEGLDYAADQWGIASRLSKSGKIVYDKRITALTSARRVKKSFLRILVDFSGNLYKWARHLFRSSGRKAQHFVGKTTARRVVFGLVPVILLIGLLVYGYFIPQSQVFGQVYYQGPPVSKMIALTFDDGPNEPYTSQVLDILQQYDVKATFFLVGMNVEKYPDVARRMVAAGDVIGNHSYSHSANHAISNFGVNDFKRAEEAIYANVFVMPHLYRPPHSKKSPWELDAVKRAGMVEINWNIAANEIHKDLIFGKPTPHLLAKEIVSQARAGGIIDLHDGYGTEHNTTRSDKSVLVQALPIIIQQLEANGYNFVTVPQLLNIPAYEKVAPVFNID